MQERRRAARISKNRPLACELKRSFIEAWAKDVTAGALHEGDVECDQNRPRTSPAAAQLPINYSSVVEMLRRPPLVPDTATAAAAGVVAEPGARIQQSGSAAPTTAVAARAEEASQPTAGLHHAGLSITPASLLHPRFNPADATTIIGGDSDDEEAASPSAVLETEEDGGMTAAFEAVLFGRPADTASTGKLSAGGDALVWPSAAGSNLQGDVERRLHAVESALSGVLLQEDAPLLRMELRKVQEDNAKLRQELGSFSTHASTLLTQLQAQVQQVLLASSSNASGPAAAAPPQPYQRQQLPHTGVTGAFASATSPGSGQDFGLGRVAAPQQLPQQPHHTSFMNGLPQQVGLRPTSSPPRIFADIAGPSLQSPYPLRRDGVGSGGDGEANHPASVPHPILLSNIEDEELALPSFATFRRSTGVAAYTSARPTAGAHVPMALND
ncbi:hypothetical protein TSOC_001133, partial [Tetrabaena socialis]